MAQQHDTAPEESRIPVLVFPRRETVVDGRAVTFEWRPIPHARAHRLQIAADAGFETIVLDEDVSGRDAFEVADTFSTDGQTYFWRILAEDEQGHVRGQDNIESFVGGTGAEAAQYDRQVTGAEEEEAYGPVGGLVRGAATEAAAEVTGDEYFFRKEVEMGVAHEGIAAGQILAIIGAIVLALVLIVVALIQYTQITAQQVRYSAVGLSGYPELRESRTQAVRELSEYGVVDAEEGIYRVPIERAIELMANEAYQQQDQGWTRELTLVPQDTTRQ